MRHIFQRGQDETKDQFKKYIITANVMEKQFLTNIRVYIYILGYKSQRKVPPIICKSLDSGILIDY